MPVLIFFSYHSYKILINNILFKNNIIKYNQQFFKINAWFYFSFLYLRTIHDKEGMNIYSLVGQRYFWELIHESRLIVIDFNLFDRGIKLIRASEDRSPKIRVRNSIMWHSALFLFDSTHSINSTRPHHFNLVLVLIKQYKIVI